MVQLLNFLTLKFLIKKLFMIVCAGISIDKEGKKSILIDKKNYWFLTTLCQISIVFPIDGWFFFTLYMQM